MLTHRVLAGLCCTTGLVLLAAEALRPPRAPVLRSFAAPYAAAMAVWCVLGWRLDSGSLVLISLVQLTASCLLFAGRRPA